MNKTILPLVGLALPLVLMALVACSEKEKAFASPTGTVMAWMRAHDSQDASAMVSYETEDCNSGMNTSLRFRRPEYREEHYKTFFDLLRSVSRKNVTTVVDYEKSTSARIKVESDEVAVGKGGSRSEKRVGHVFDLIRSNDKWLISAHKFRNP